VLESVNPRDGEAMGQQVLAFAVVSGVSGFLVAVIPMTSRAGIAAHAVTALLFPGSGIMYCVRAQQVGP
jgi:hypothetical protein